MIVTGTDRTFFEAASLPVSGSSNMTAHDAMFIEVTPKVNNPVYRPGFGCDMKFSAAEDIDRSPTVAATSSGGSSLESSSDDIPHYVSLAVTFTVELKKKFTSLGSVFLALLESEPVTGIVVLMSLCQSPSISAGVWVSETAFIVARKYNKHR